MKELATFRHGRECKALLRFLIVIILALFLGWAIGNVVMGPN